MILSHKHKFIFFKSHKTAGTSMEMALATCCGEKDIVTPLCFSEDCGGNYGVEKGYSHPTKNHKEKKFNPHASPREVKEKISPETWDTYYKFSIIRNPWDRMVSQWWWWWARGDNYQNLNFSEFIKERKPFPWCPKFCDWFTDVDFLIRFENLRGDYEKACDHLKISPVMLPRAKGGFRKKKAHYSKYYTRETKQIVADHYRKDIDQFNYSFSGSP